MVNSQHYVTKITSIKIDPDRFGRLHPVIWFDTIIHNKRMYCKSYLGYYDHLTQYQYAVGDLITIRFIGHCPVLGEVVEKSHGNRPYQDTKPIYCHHCQQGLTTYHGELYCTSEYCPRTVFSRLSYSNQQNVLDLPVDCKLLDYLVWGQQIVDDLPSLLYIKASDIPKLWYEDDEIDAITSQLAYRTDQLHGRGYDNSVQYAVQDKVLDALSIPGLCSKDRQKLCDRLHQKHWSWANLPEVLTDQPMLKRYGVNVSDARVIASSMSKRVEELDRLAREF